MSAPGSPQAERIARLEAENTMLRERLLQYELTLAEAEQQPSPMATTSAQFPGSTNAHGLPTTAPTAQRYTNMWADDVETYPPRPSFDKVPNHPSTEVVAFDGCPNDPYHPSSMPIYQTATFVQPSINEFGEYDYTRSGNPTRTAVETLAAKLEAAHAAFAFTSGMAALANLISLFNAGDEILAGDDLYGGMHRLLTQVANKQGITVRFVDTTNADALESQITPGKTKLLHIESPTNPRMRITDLRAVCAIAHQHGAYVSVDCTMMTPVRCQPLALGCDAVVHSATKFFSGHSDVMGGFLCVKDPTLARRAAFNQNAVGTALAPFDCWLMLRGLKTLVLRVERMELNALAVARYLSNQQHFITALHYAGLNPSKAPEEVRRLLTVTQAAYDTHRSQCTGPGTVLSFETGSIERSKAFVNACRLFKLTVSFGSCNSLVEMPCALSHASIPKDQRTLPEDLVRLSIGIESVHDLIRDISHAIREALLAAAPAATEDDNPK